MAAFELGDFVDDLTPALLVRLRVPAGVAGLALGFSTTHDGAGFPVVGVVDQLTALFVDDPKLVAKHPNLLADLSQPSLDHKSHREQRMPTLDRRRENACMALHPNGVHHLAISTTNIKAQIEFFTQVLGAELKALYWMHGVENTFHGFIELNESSYVAFVQHPENSDRREYGLSHAATAGSPIAGGAMQHVAFSVDSLDDLYAMRDRVRAHGVPVIGPMNHGMCQSMYFAGPEGLCLEVATGSDIDERAWIDPEVQELAGISDADLARYLQPASFDRPASAVPQPAFDPAKPHLGYPEKVYERMLATPDEAFWNAVESEPPVKV